MSLTDPDARSMKKAGGGSTEGYNVQTARRIKRWEHEAVLDAAEVELKKQPDAMRQR